MFGLTRDEWLIVFALIFLGSWLIRQTGLKDVLAIMAGRPPKPKTQDEVDIVGEIVRKKKKIARDMRKREGFGRALRYLADEDIPAKNTKYIGIIPDTRCTIFFVKLGYLQSRMLIMPTDIIVDLQRRLIPIVARGHDSLGTRFLYPIFNNNIDEEKRAYYVNTINEFMYSIFNIESAYDAQGTRLNAIATNSKTKTVDPGTLAYRSRSNDGETEPINEGGVQ